MEWWQLRRAFDIGLATSEDFSHGRLHNLGRQVGVALRHLHTRVAEYLLHNAEAHAVLN